MKISACSGSSARRSCSPPVGSTSPSTRRSTPTAPVRSSSPAVVDKDVVDRVPGLAGSLVLDDATAAGWVVEGPAATEDGGLTVTLRHPFTTVQEAANLLNSLGPPFGNVVVRDARHRGRGDRDDDRDAVAARRHVGRLRRPGPADVDRRHAVRRPAHRVRGQPGGVDVRRAVRAPARRDRGDHRRPPRRRGPLVGSARRFGRKTWRREPCSAKVAAAAGPARSAPPPSSCSSPGWCRDRLRRVVLRARSRRRSRPVRRLY